MGFPEYPPEWDEEDEDMTDEEVEDEIDEIEADEEAAIEKAQQDYEDMLQRRGE